MKIPSYRDVIRNEFGRAWVMSQSTARKGVYVPTAYIDINGGFDSDGKLFAQIMYWHEPDENGNTRLRRHTDGEYWITKNHADWFEETRIKERTVRNALERIQARGLIFYELHGEAGRKTPWIRVNWDEFERRMQIWMDHIGIKVKEEDYEAALALFSDEPPLEINVRGAGNGFQGAGNYFQGGLETVSIPLEINVESNTESTTESTSKNTSDIGCESSIAQLRSLRHEKHIGGSTVEPPPTTYNELEEIILKSVRANVLTDKIRDLLNREVIYVDYQTQEEVRYPSPNSLYQSSALFREFAVGQINHFRSLNLGPAKIVANLCSYNSKYGWLDYQKKHQPVTLPEEKKEVVIQRSGPGKVPGLKLVD